MLNNFGNITASGCVYRHPDCPPLNLFWIDPLGHENFWCSVKGETSGTSSYPRTECRETDACANNFNWTIGDHDHAMRGQVRVLKTPSKGKVIVGQIHAHGASSPFLMVSHWNCFARVDLRPTPGADVETVLSLPVLLGERFEYELKITPERNLYIKLNDEECTVPVKEEWDKYPFYFKRGAYVIDCEGPPEEGGWVVYEDSLVTHQDCT
ncbi:polysaccharide lyase family 7 protein [Pseudomonas brassicacearum]|uniref:polysaccharide lyase family 7 protein n=1 Tax=Pseudomonas brassicacearum TaxID=930166 RepID=UPI001D3624EE|nr:polysaccharide lyase family 7 protein [Pseudomonas brassicacearum]CAH0284444.1 hypothetical protein SRABI06_04043 [Pseudomonas brassicacearum]